ncbi:hypothetical protein [Fimbriimonas ginsengisoli]|uniref:hypothetical protein n=1 Tax=Fimbriimonas ginsengisoli TaxID=1005039 RepID=UPI00046CB728|nr:hypothetical protein [Fimbriimonas ginsengisoli]
MQTEFVVIIVTLAIGILSLFSKVHNDGITERLNTVGWILLFFLIGSAYCGYVVARNNRLESEKKERELVSFQSEVRNLQQQLKAESASADKFHGERDAFSKEVDRLRAIIDSMPSSLPGRIDATIGNGTWDGDTITLRLNEADALGQVTAPFSGARFNGTHKDPVFHVSVVNVSPEDIKKVVFKGVTYVGQYINMRCSAFMHGQEIALTTHTDTDGTYAVMINNSEADRTALSILLKSNPNAGIQLRYIGLAEPQR